MVGYPIDLEIQHIEAYWNDHWWFSVLQIMWKSMNSLYTIYVGLNMKRAAKKLHPALQNYKEYWSGYMKYESIS